MMTLKEIDELNMLLACTCIRCVCIMHALTVILVERYDDIPDALYVDCSLLK